MDQNQKAKPHQFDVSKLYKAADEVIDGMNPPKRGGWYLPAIDYTVPVQKIELADGRTAQLQVYLTCEELNWIEQSEAEEASQ